MSVVTQAQATLTYRAVEHKSDEELLKMYDGVLRQLIAAAGRVDMYATKELRDAASEVWVNYQLAYASRFMEDPPERPLDMQRTFGTDVQTVLNIMEGEFNIA